MLGEITNAESHGENSNGMAKINDKIFCSGGENSFIYIISASPIKIIQKIYLGAKYYYIRYLHRSYDGFIFTYFKNKIIQFKTIFDRSGNFIKLVKFDEICDADDTKAITTTDEGKIFYKKKNKDYSEKSIFILNYYKNKYDFQITLNKYYDF